jgi:DNA-binding MarR family transcriptional regulator
MKSSDPFVVTFTHLIEVFMRTNVRSMIQFTRESGVSMSQVGTLFNIDRTHCGVAGIGDDLGVSSAAASQMLQRMVEQGLVLRSEDPDDRRAKQVALTDKGRGILDQMMRAREDQLEKLAGALTPSERKS